MTNEIQQYLKERLQTCTDIPVDYIYTELRDENEYQLVPFASILPEIAQIETAWNNEQSYRREDGKTVKVIRKYRVSQPWTIYIRRGTKSECMADAEALLSSLHKKIVVQNIAAEIIPTGQEFLLAKGALDHFEAKISLTVEYGVFAENTIENNIESIKIEVKDVE